MPTDAKRSPFQIKTVTESDWPWIVQSLVEIAWARLNDDQRRGISRQHIQKLVKQHVAQVRGEDGLPNQAFIAKTQNGQPAGFVWVARTQNESTGRPEASLLNQYVAKTYRGQGLGHRLMETAEEWARQQGLMRISVRVSVRNELGQKLYEALGYEIDMLRMTKPLTAQKSNELSLSND
jgi:ribosomal protein S18 acetylase RimI-like enzyme